MTHIKSSRGLSFFAYTENTHEREACGAASPGTGLALKKSGFQSRV